MSGRRGPIAPSPYGQPYSAQGSYSAGSNRNSPAGSYRPPQQQHHSPYASPAHSFGGGGRNAHPAQMYQAPPQMYQAPPQQRYQPPPAGGGVYHGINQHVPHNNANQQIDDRVGPGEAEIEEEGYSTGWESDTDAEEDSSTALVPVTSRAMVKSRKPDGGALPTPVGKGRCYCCDRTMASCMPSCSSALGLLIIALTCFLLLTTLVLGVLGPWVVVCHVRAHKVCASSYGILPADFDSCVTRHCDRNTLGCDWRPGAIMTGAACGCFVLVFNYLGLLCGCLSRNAKIATVALRQFVTMWVAFAVVGCIFGPQMVGVHQKAVRTCLLISDPHNNTLCFKQECSTTNIGTLPCSLSAGIAVTAGGYGMLFLGICTLCTLYFTFTIIRHK